jgi:hypothetical protein
MCNNAYTEYYKKTILKYNSQPRLQRCYFLHILQNELAMQYICLHRKTALKFSKFLRLSITAVPWKGLQDFLILNVSAGNKFYRRADQFQRHFVTESIRYTTSLFHRFIYLTANVRVLLQ